MACKYDACVWNLGLRASVPDLLVLAIRILACDKIFDISHEIEATCLTRICTMARNLDATAFYRPMLNLRHGDYRRSPQNPRS